MQHTQTYSLRGRSQRILEYTTVEEYSYVYTGGSLIQMVLKTTTTPADGEATTTTETLNFSYDASGVPLAVDYNGTDYYYVANIQGDVVALLNTSGEAVVEYTYDAWGNIHSVTGSLANTLGEVNPLTYRGYVYDQEIGLFYLQSRYYDPEMARFINADGLVATGQGLLGNNMFAYCNNCPVNCFDPSGHGILSAIALGALKGGVSWLISSLISGEWDWGDLGISIVSGAIGGFGAVGTIIGACIDMISIVLSCAENGYSLSTTLVFMALSGVLSVADFSKFIPELDDDTLKIISKILGINIDILSGAMSEIAGTPSKETSEDNKSTSTQTTEQTSHNRSETNGRTGSMRRTILVKHCFV